MNIVIMWYAIMMAGTDCTTDQNSKAGCTACVHCMSKGCKLKGLCLLAA